MDLSPPGAVAFEARRQASTPFQQGLWRMDQIAAMLPGGVLPPTIDVHVATSTPRGFSETLQAGVAPSQTWALFRVVTDSPDAEGEAQLQNARLVLLASGTLAWGSQVKQRVAPVDGDLGWTLFTSSNVATTLQVSAPDAPPTVTLPTAAESGLKTKDLTEEALPDLTRGLSKGLEKGLGEGLGGAASSLPWVLGALALAVLFLWYVDKKSKGG